MLSFFSFFCFSIFRFSFFRSFFDCFFLLFLLGLIFFCCLRLNDLVCSFYQLHYVCALQQGCQLFHFSSFQGTDYLGFLFCIFQFQLIEFLHHELQFSFQVFIFLNNKQNTSARLFSSRFLLACMITMVSNSFLFMSETSSGAEGLAASW
jgi:hypothetical protein